MTWDVWLGAFQANIMRAHIRNTDNVEIFQFVTFHIGKEEYGVDILDVQEIIRMTSISQLPNISNKIDEIVNLRGIVIAVMDLRKRFGLESRNHDSQTRIVVVKINDRLMGGVVDAVLEVLRIPANTVESQTSLTDNITTDYVSGIAKLKDRLVLLIDLGRIFARELVELPDQEILNNA